MDPTEALLPYLPMEVRRSLAYELPLEERANGAALFADMSGFTAMSAAFARGLGPSAGAELMARQLETYFAALVRPVHDFRGSVVGFGGDAISCWFDDAAGSESATRRALAAATNMRAAVESLPPINSPAGQPVRLGVKIALASGPAIRVIVGNPAIQRLEAFVGRTIDRMATAEQVAERGEIAVAEEVVREVGDGLTVVAWRTGANGERFAVVSPAGEHPAKDPWPALPGIPLDRLRGWLHAGVSARILRGEGRFLSGFRPVVTLFFRFTGIDYHTDAEAGAKLDSVVRATQEIVDTLGGQLIDVSVGDKGSYLFVAFGALKVHEDEARRAVAAARDLQALARDLRFLKEVQVGVSRGEDYVGAYGCDARRTFGVVGTEVNLAARLMTLAAAGEVVVTSRVAAAAARHFEFAALAAQSLKGLPEEVTPHVLRGLRSHSTPPGALPAPRLFGRDAEKVVLERALSELCAGRGGHLIIEGEAGIGKSRLVEWVLERARELGVTSFVGAGDGLLRGAPYHAWRPILLGVLGIDPHSGAAARIDSATADRARAAVEEQGAGAVDFAPLLNPVLGIELRETARTRAMDPHSRAQATQGILADLVLARARKDALLVVVEDLHWVDSASAALLRFLGRQAGPLLVIATQRPLAHEESRALEDELSGVAVRLLELGPLAQCDIEALLRERLPARSLPPALLKLVDRLAQGSPFFSQEIAFALRDRGMIEITPEAQCRITSTARNLDAVDFPDSVQGVIASRIDTLPAAHQLALKVASVLGTTFDAAVLEDIHPVAADRDDLDAILRHLIDVNLLVCADAASGATHSFRHALTRDVAYGMLLRNQRIEMHRAAVRRYERRAAGDPYALVGADAAAPPDDANVEHARSLSDRAARQPPLSPAPPSQSHDRSEFLVRVLAHHAARAVDPDAADAAEATARAIGYLDQAAEQAIEGYANEEVIEFLDRAVRLDGPRRPARRRVPDAGDPLFRNARWHERLARAHAALGDLESSRRASELCLQLLGRPMPAGPSRMLLPIAAQAAVQFSRRIIGDVPSVRKVTDAERPSLELVNSVFWLLSKALYHESHPAPHIYLNLHNLNLAERLGPSAELGIAYSVMQMTLAVLGLHGAAESYSRRALATARAYGRPADIGAVLFNDGICRVGAGQWQRAATSLGEARELARASRHDQLFDEACAVEADAAIFQGDLTRASTLYHQVYQVAKRQGSLLHMGWCMRPAAVAALRAGHWHVVVAIVQEGTALRSQVADPLTEIDAQGMLANALFRQGEVASAWQALDRVATLAAAASPPVAYPRLLGLSAATETCLDILEQGRLVETVVARHEDALRMAKRLCAALAAYAATFPIGRPAARIQQARYHALLGRKRRAARCFADAIASAERLAMPYELGTAHLVAARYSAGVESERRRHLDAALATFGRLDASFPYALAAELSRSPALGPPAPLGR